MLFELLVPQRRLKTVVSKPVEESNLRELLVFVSGCSETGSSFSLDLYGGIQQAPSGPTVTSVAKLRARLFMYQRGQTEKRKNKEIV